MDRLRQMSEEGIAGFFNEVMSNDRMRSSFGKAGERFMADSPLVPPLQMEAAE